MNYIINVDEFQFFHSAWMVGHGHLPYRDFWTNNSPLFIYLLKPLVAHYDEKPSSLLMIARLLAWLVNLLLVWLVATIAAWQRSWMAGLFAALLLSVNLTVFQFTVEVRHDSLTVICELLALALLARGIRDERSRDVLGAGALLGCAIALTPKGLFGLIGLVIGCLIHHLLVPPGTERRQALMRCRRHVGALLTGSLGTFALVFLSLLPLDTWSLMIERVFVDGVTNPDRFSPLTRYLLRDITADPMSWLVMLGGFGVAARQWSAGSLRRDPVETLLLFAGLWFGVTYLFLMTSPYPQSALPFIAVLSIFGGRLLAIGVAQLSAGAPKGGTVALASCLGLVVGWIALSSAWSIFQNDPQFRRGKADQVRLIEYVLSVTGPEDAVFDGNSAYIFRPQASYYGSLVWAVLMRIQRGELKFDIPERCERLGCKVVIMDGRIAQLPEPIQAWIRKHYLPSPVLNQVLLHRSLVSDSGSAGQQSANHL